MDEILEQPAALERVRSHYTGQSAISAKALAGFTRSQKPLVIFTGMGSSLFAAYPAHYFLSAAGIRSVVWEMADLLHHHLGFLGRDALLVAVSQSGETVEIVRLLERLPKKARVVGVTNEASSTLARRANLLLPMFAGRQATVSTKTYICPVAALMYLAHALARRPSKPLTETLARAIELQERVLDRRDALAPPVADFIGSAPYVALMSRGADAASVHQGALMFKEVARLPAEPMSAAQFRHGPIEIVHPDHRYVIFARENWYGGRSRQSGPAALLVKLAEEILRRGARVLCITDRKFEDSTNARVIEAAPLKLGLGTLVDSVFIQLLVHELALRAGREPGKFWICQPVTLEE